MDVNAFAALIPKVLAVVRVIGAAAVPERVREYRPSPPTSTIDPLFPGSTSVQLGIATLLATPTVPKVPPVTTGVVELRSRTGPAIIVMALVSLSVLIPPEPVLPPSLVSMVSVAEELDEKVGAVASRKALMLATVPLSVKEAVPLLVTATPPPDMAASVPALTLKVVVITPTVPASTSETARPANTTGALLLPLNVVGKVLIGASLTAARVMVLVSTSVLMPPVPMLPPSLVVMVSTTSPLKLLTGT